MVPSLQPAPGIYADELWEGLDYLLVEMGKRDMRAVVCLNNFWPWSGGMAQYLAWDTGEAIPYPNMESGKNWARYQHFTTRFYKNKGAQAVFEAHVRKVVGRVNGITGVPYTEGPYHHVLAGCQRTPGDVFPKSHAKMDRENSSAH